MLVDYLQIKQFKDWNKAKAFLGSFGPDWLFRGQGDNTWGLTTTLERATGKPLHMLRLYEEWIRAEFERGAHHYLSPQHLPADDMEWLALMQHHGAPTRLLDFSESPYIAAYFALEGCRKWCSVWAIHAAFLTTAGGVASDQNEDFFMMGDYEKPYLDVVFSFPRPWVFPVAPRRKNERLLAQQGRFLLPVDSTQTFEDNLGAALACPDLKEWNRTVYRIDIHHSVVAMALSDLSRMNISRATLFPGLDGFAQSLRFKHFTP